MARIRTIKPGFFRSESVAALDFGTRLTWAGLWTYCDDQGRGVDNPRIIKAELWALDDDYTHNNVADDLDTLESAGMICRYEVDGKSYLHVVKWSDHQVVNNPNKEALPRCPTHDNAPPQGSDQDRSESTETLKTSSGESTETLKTSSVLEGEGELGKGTGEKDLEPPAGFAGFWVAYPRKVGKPSAVKAWKRLPPQGHPAVMAGLDRWNRYWQASRTSSEHIPHPATWLNDCRWESDVPVARASPARVVDPIAEYRRNAGLSEGVAE